MIQRIKWMRVKSRLSLDVLHQYFDSTKFNERNGFGFYDVELSNSILKANYVEKELAHTTFTDPFGETHEQTIISYNDFHFQLGTLHNDIHLLSIYNPPKTIKKFLDRISSNLDYEVTFSLVDLDISKLISNIEHNKSVSLFKIGRIKISGIRFNHDSTGCLELVSKGNALDDLTQSVPEKYYIIDKVKGSFIFNSERLTFEVSKNGLLSTNGEQEAVRFISNAGFSL